eukprot:TRINITY_DN6636_c0_g1_i1.p1 TRINITY_DN6636_c0_g1~~TRINITY_DN6636_c0_g1_i1.p1  ORF type:complete len:199 (-),score=25.80 TRINITY_DN6636_c0_g1_i1:140-679(-)
MGDMGVRGRGGKRGGRGMDRRNPDGRNFGYEYRDDGYDDSSYNNEGEDYGDEGDGNTEYNEYNDNWGNHNNHNNMNMNGTDPSISNNNYAPNKDPNKAPLPGAMFKKKCIYFHSAKGCRKGSECTFIHDSNSPIPPSSNNSMGMGMVSNRSLEILDNMNNKFNNGNGSNSLDHQPQMII